MNSLLLAMSMSGSGISQGTIDAMQAMRQRNYEKLTMFVKWLVTTLVYGYYWLKKHPAVVQADANTPDTTGVGTQALVNSFWDRQDQKDFIANMIRDGADLLLAWLKPDEYEMKMWAAMMQHPSPVAQLPALITNQQASLQQLLQQLSQLPVPAPALPAPAAGGIPPMGNMTREQYIAAYGIAPPASSPPATASVRSFPQRRGSEY